MTMTTTRTVLRFPLDEREYVAGMEIATIRVPANDPKVLHVGTGTSPRVCAWVEVDDVRDIVVTDDGPAKRLPDEGLVPILFGFLASGDTIPEGASFVAITAEFGPTGPAIRHIYRLA